MTHEAGGDRRESNRLETVGRRAFFGRVAAAIAAAIGAVLALPLVGYIVSPALKRRAPDWSRVGAVAALLPDEPQTLTFVATQQDGWRKSTVMHAVWVVKRPDGALTAFAPNCTHLGCAYHWDGGARQFQCPCHNSVFALDGAVVSGPAPRPLDTLAAKIEGDELWVRYAQFRAGIARKLEI